MERYQKWTLLLIAALLTFRVGALLVSPLGLHGDEAQYWAWSKDLDWGYFTKPPLIAWTIWVTTSLFGDAEWAVRLSSPVLHSITTLFLEQQNLSLMRKQDSGRL
jgi:4-amino-4-deoxy-L-arabinose transferase-like glycosyltransferase